MSFVNLMANDIWSEADIIRRTEAMIHSEFPADKENILNRKATGAALGHYILSDEEKAELIAYARISETSRLAGIKAREDMKLLHEVLAHENYFRLLQMPHLEPEIINDVIVNQEALDMHLIARQEAELALKNVSPKAIELLTLRNPVKTIENTK